MLGLLAAGGLLRRGPLGWIRINPAVYFIDHLPVHVELVDVGVVVLSSLAIAVLATSIPPARRDSRRSRRSARVSGGCVADS